MARQHASCKSPRLARSGSSNDGFTLVEVVFAIFVLTVGLVAMAQLLAVSVRMHQLGRNTEIATQLAERKFEELMKLNFDTAPEVQITGVDSLAADVANYFDTPAGTLFTRRWLVEAGPVDRTRRVTVRMVPAQTDRLLYKPVQLTTIIRQW
jgi:prepilin-type N-terminal cleavage/methylation domain-containing protein